MAYPCHLIGHIRISWSSSINVVLVWQKSKVCLVVYVIHMCSLVLLPFQYRFVTLILCSVLHA